jgi:oxalate decarboxylase/phosphoglucose isomerase-like protein (cupin superfamily)
MSYSNVRIFSDGTPLGLKVTTRSGEIIPCSAVHFTQNNGEAPVVTLVLEGAAVDLDPDTLRKQEQQRIWGADEALAVCRPDMG